jgi:hypothetical protein
MTIIFIRILLPPYQEGVIAPQDPFVGLSLFTGLRRRKV